MSDHPPNQQPAFWHAQGKYDACCELLMHVRLKGTAPALREIADAILKYDPQHPHAKWAMENLK